MHVFMRLKKTGGAQKPFGGSWRAFCALVWADSSGIGSHSAVEKSGKRLH
jgi:hypothetical protein